MATFDLNARKAGDSSFLIAGKGRHPEFVSIDFDAETFDVKPAIADDILFFTVPKGSYVQAVTFEIVTPNAGAATANVGFTGALTAVATAQDLTAAATVMYNTPQAFAVDTQFIATIAGADIDKLHAVMSILIAQPGR